ncbi:hypothetical protein [Enterococcus sp.]|uniref:hypothetical protein n=1 Tax=Enterococcus sp. TaxID=35783 RepID=UPI00290F6BDC|nr:hypothetical protein [Enterococcus sp.]MDU5336748.1 hypothetical protein [Enterococcus sp.]
MTDAGVVFSSAIKNYREAITLHMEAQDMGVIQTVGQQSRSHSVQEKVGKIARKL